MIDPITGKGGRPPLYSDPDVMEAKEHSAFNIKNIPGVNSDNIDSIRTAVYHMLNNIYGKG